MTREDLIKRICVDVLNEDAIPIKDLEDAKKCSSSDFQKGLYFLFTKDNICIYVGKVGGGEKTSLYHRMVGHGKGSHKKRDERWYNQISYGKWHQFKVIGKKLALLERLAIFGMGQPIYNDVDSDQSAVNNIENLNIL